MNARTRSVTLGVLLLVSLGSWALVASADTREISVTVQPSTIVLAASSTWVTVHTDIAYGEVDAASLTLNGVAINWSKSDNRGNFVAKFVSGDVKEILQPGTALLTLSGTTKSGESFEGSDVVTVK